MEKLPIIKLKEIFESDAFKNGRVLIVDVRTGPEYREEHIDGAINYPLDNIDSHKEELSEYEAVFMHCRTGKRSATACETLGSLGLDNVVTLEGGIESWKESGGETVKGKKAISIFRQVLISAGSIVLIGSLLTLAFGKALLIIPLFVSLGLIYAGITDNCYMAMLLAKMPWNK